jgi:hypothetical protein
MNGFPTPEELAREAREALRRHPPKIGRELFLELVRDGFINARGQVTTLIGGSAEPEPDYETWTPDRDGADGSQKPARKPRSGVSGIPAGPCRPRPDRR